VEAPVQVYLNDIETLLRYDIVLADNISSDYCSNYVCTNELANFMVSLNNTFMPNNPSSINANNLLF